MTATIIKMIVRVMFCIIASSEMMTSLVLWHTCFRRPIYQYRYDLAYCRDQCYTIHMKRTNLVLDEEKLDQAKTVSGSRTYSETVNIALEEYIRRHTFAQIDTFAGTDVWEGDLSAMREDTPNSVSR